MERLRVTGGAVGLKERKENMANMEATDLNIKDNRAFERVYRLDKCEVTLWKDGLVTITSSEPKSPIISFRRAPNPWCGRD
jgi:hypothetical protein